MIAALIFWAAAAVTPLADPALEARATALDAELRCVACENEPISQSTAEIATDMRAMVRERIAAGDSDAQVRAFFAKRYGDFVLLRPPLKGQTAILWATPVLLMGLGLALAWRLRRAPGAADEPVGDDAGAREDEI